MNPIIFLIHRTLHQYRMNFYMSQMVDDIFAMPATFNCRCVGTEGLTGQMKKDLDELGDMIQA